MKKKSLLISVLLLVVMVSLSFAACKGKVYTVTFMNGTETAFTREVKDGLKAEKPEDKDNPTRVGSVFSHWSLTENGQTEYNWDLPVKGNIILYAVWDVAKVTVTFMDRTTQFTTQTINYGTAPAAPTSKPVYAGHFFKYWSTSTSGEEYKFGVNNITVNLTLYAVWVEIVALDPEWTVSFDLNYQDAANPPASMTTEGGMLLSLPTAPTRQNYDFKGWWISQYNDGLKLSYPLVIAGTIFEEDDTVYALWHPTDTGSKLAAPVAYVYGNSVKWEAVPNALTYRLTIDGPTGFTDIVDETVTGTSRNVPFSTSSEGDYIIKVTAVSSVVQNNSAAAEIYYVNKVLARVSVFEVIETAGTTGFVFNKVANATKYLITIDCGDSSHSHTDKDIGDTDNYDFSGCLMQPGGIKFIIKAAAAGWVTSVSREFVFDKTLPAVTGIAINEADQTISWDLMPNATSYSVTVACADTSHVLSNIIVDNPTSKPISIKECAKGDLTITVIARANGWNPSPVVAHPHTKTILASPRGIAFDEQNKNKLVWIEVAGAASYVITIEGQTLTSNTNSIVIPSTVNFAADYDNQVTIIAKGATTATDSLASDIFIIRTTMSTPTYETNFVRWASVLGAEYYEVRLNEGAPIHVESNLNQYRITFAGTGKQTIEVRMYGGGEYSDWMAVERTVIAYSLTYDSQDGASVDTIYVAIGDNVTLSNTTRDGYTFNGWYPAENGGGLKYEDSFNFSGTTNLTVFASWTARKFTVTYDYQGKTEGAKSILLTYDLPYTLAKTSNNTDDGLLFLGWYEEENGGGQRFTDELFNSINVWKGLENITVYAFWGRVLKYELTNNGKAYSVLQDRETNLINDMSVVTIPHMYNGLPVSTIDSYAFWNSSRMVKVLIPNTIKLVSAMAFEGCTKLIEFEVYEVEGNLYDIAYAAVDGLLFKVLEKDGEFDGYQFAAFPPGRGGEFRIPDVIVRIDNRMFRDMVGITKIIIHAGVTSIGTSAFEGCTGLEEIAFDENSTLTTIGNYAFRNCTNLTKITIPNSVKDIDDAGTTISGIGIGVFLGCSKLTTVIFEKGGKDALSIASAESASEGTFYFCDALNSIEFPNRLVSIGNYAFYSCKYLNPITFEKGGELDLTIGVYSFAYCNRLTSIEIPSRTVIINNRAFQSCAILNSVTFEKTLEGDERALKIGTDVAASYVFNECNVLANIIIPTRVSSIGGYAFSSCSSLTTLKFDKGGEDDLTFGNYIFANSALKSIEIPNRVTEIGNYAFYKCINLEELTFEDEGDKPLAFGSNLFSGCTALKTLTIPARVTDISFETFTSTSSVSDNGIDFIDVDSKNAKFSADEGVLYNKDKTTLIYFPSKKTGSFTIPGSVTRIGDNAFAFYKGFSALTLSEKVTHIGSYAFRDNAFTSIIFLSPTAITIDKGAFYNCYGLQTMLFAEGGSVSFGANAFQNCTSLLNVTLPARIASIGDNAFLDCVSLKKIDFASGSTLASIGANAFKGCISLTTLILPASVSSISNTMLTGAVSITSVQVAEGNQSFSSFEGVLYNKQMTEIVYYPIGKKGTYRIPNTITIIKASTFMDYKNLEGVWIPASVTQIEDSAFRNCSNLASVEFEEGGNKELIIGNVKTNAAQTYVFENCISLTALKIPARVKTIYNNAFAGCINLASVSFEKDSQIHTIGNSVFQNCYALKQIELPEGLWGIGDSVFRGTGLTSIHIPASVERLAMVFYTASTTSYAFADCYDLKTVTFAAGSKLTIIGDYAFQNSGIIGIEIPKSVINIYNGAFLGSEVGSITFEDGGTENLTIAAGSTSGGTFASCPNLTTIIFPKRLTNLGTYAFRNSIKLTAVSFASVGTLNMLDLTIGAQAFIGSGVENIILPHNTISVGNFAFQNCFALETLTFEELTGAAKTLTLNNSIVQYCNSLTKINLPSRNITLTAGVAVFRDTPSLTEFKIAGGTSLKVIDGVLFNYSGNTLICYPAGRTETTYDVPNSVTTIRIAAFANTVNLTTVTFAKGGSALTMEGTSEATSVFQYSGITSIEIPARLTDSGQYTFTRCYNLKDVTFESGCGLITLGNYMFRYTAIEEITIPSSIATIGEYVFADCTELDEVKFATGSGLKTIGASAFRSSGINRITLPQGLTTINGSAFAYSDLESIHIPSSVNSFGGTFIFNYCSQLEEVTFATGINLTSFNTSTFQNSGLRRITLPASLTTYTGDLFTNCLKLAYIDVATGSGNFSSKDGVLYNKDGDTLYYYPIAMTAQNNEYRVADDTITVFGSAFYGSTLNKIIIPDSVATIGISAFAYTSFLNTIEFEESDTPLTFTAASSASYSQFYYSGLNTIQLPARMVATSTLAYLFYYCRSLTEVTFEEGLTVSAVGASAFYNCSNLGSLVVPNGAQSIGASAFYNCVELIGVTLPEGVTSIGANAFEKCYKLLSVNLPEGLQSIGNYAFRDCESLLSVQIPDTVKTLGNYTFLNCFDLVSANLPRGVTSYATTTHNYFFQNCYSLTSMVIPSTVTTFTAQYFFQNCTSLESVIINASAMATIPTYMFDGCTKLVEVNIPSTVTTIAAYAFQNCSSLESIVIPQGVTTINIGAFRNCSSLKNVVLPASISTFGTTSAVNNPFAGTDLDQISFADDNSRFLQEDGVLYNADKTAIVFYSPNKTDETFDFPASVTTINGYAFAGSKFLKEVVIPATVTTISTYAFADCIALEKVTIPGHLSSVPNYMFWGCTALDEVIFEESNMDLFIGEFAFANSGLKTITLPKRLASALTTSTPNAAIRASAFAGCADLSEVIFAERDAEDLRPFNIGANVFENCTSLESITFPDYLKDVRYISSGNITYASVLGNAAFKGSGIKSMVIPVTKVISNELFMNCTSLTSVTLPAALENINTSAFQGCIELASIDIPASVKEIGTWAFYLCENLETVVLREGLLIIGSQTFNGCVSLRNISLPNSITTIQNQAFENCVNIPSIIIPFGVTTLRENSFRGWTSSQTIYVRDSKAPAVWSGGWDNTGANIIFNYKDPTP